MNKFLPALVAAAALFSCNNTTEEKKEEPVIDSTPAQPVKTTASNTCYRSVVGKDTVDLQLSVTGNLVTGQLHYNHFEKDDNKGTISGELKGDTLVALYTFQSEGMSSVREVVFLKKNGGWAEGFGDVEEKDGRMAFKDRAKLKFEEGELKVVECK